MIFIRKLIDRSNDYLLKGIIEGSIAQSETVWTEGFRVEANHHFVIREDRSKDHSQREHKHKCRSHLVLDVAAS